MISSTRLRAAARVSILCLAPLVMASILVAQRAGTITTTTKPGSSTKSMTLEQRIEALEKRVEELEKDIDKFELDSDTESARDKKLEERLAAIERAQRAGRAAGPGADKASNDDDQPLTVRAPFVVMDEAGKTLMRVEKSAATAGARMILGNPVGSRLVMGVQKGDGAGFQMYDNADEQRVAIGVFVGATTFKLRDKQFNLMLSTSGAEGSTVSLFKGDVVSARLAGGPAGYGRMVLSSGAGVPMVEAGTADGLGVVRAGPRMGGPPGGLTGQPFAIVGKKGGE
jgi:hypothetical protein